MSGCGGTADTHVAAWTTEPELWIFGVYEPLDRGPSIAVDVQRSGRVILVLSSYEPTRWDLTLGPSTTLERVVLNGCHDHDVTGAGGAPVEDLSGAGSYLEACAYRWPSSAGGCVARGLVSQAEASTGVALTGFVGCYGGSDLRIEDAPDARVRRRAAGRAGRERRGRPTRRARSGR
ncbi:MAG TPA: hypothetical protein RMH99_30785 [Sandaracinaceae bacterium LLY-WYZ-13_1]|nr:hypothetical protein [Sandaracinaceae bacterium LLY-WYZ-13_1]